MGRAQRQLHEPRIARLSDEGEDLRAGAPLGAESREPFAAAGDDERHVAPGLHVVDVGRLPHVAALGGEGRTRHGPARLSLGARDQGRLFPADEGSRPGHDLDIEGEAGVEDALPEEAGDARLGDRLVEAVDRQRIFGTHVDHAFGRPHRISPEGHALDEHMRIRLDLVAVHIGAGVALVRVADDRPVRRALGAHDLPLLISREARAPAAAQLGFLELFDHDFGLHRIQGLYQARVAAGAEILLDALGVYQARIAQHQLFLALEEC